MLQMDSRTRSLLSIHHKSIIFSIVKFIDNICYCYFLNLLFSVHWRCTLCNQSVYTNLLHSSIPRWYLCDCCHTIDGAMEVNNYLSRFFRHNYKVLLPFNPLNCNFYTSLAKALFPHYHNCDTKAFRDLQPTDIPKYAYALTMLTNICYALT